MDREDIITRVKAYTNMDTTEITTLCQYHIDEIQDRIASGEYYDERGIAHYHDFSWLLDYAEINTSATYTTGTVSVTQDSTSVTGSGTSWADGHVGWIMKVGTEDEYYEVSAVGDTTTITLTSNYIGDTASGSSYTLYKVYYPLASDFKQMKWMKQMVTPQRLIPEVEINFAEYITDEFAESGEIAGYCISGQDSSENILLRFTPIQTSRKRVYYCYEKDLSTVNSEGAESDIPAKWHMAFVYGLSEIVLEMHDMPQEKIIKARSQYNEMIKRAVMEDKKRTKDRSNIYRDERLGYTPKLVHLPRDTYPDVF